MQFRRTIAMLQMHEQWLGKVINFSSAKLGMWGSLREGVSVGSEMVRFEFRGLSFISLPFCFAK